MSVNPQGLLGLRKVRTSNMRFFILCAGALVCLYGLTGGSFLGDASAVFANPSSSITEAETRPHVRDLGITIGRYLPGTWNAITDVPGVKVGHVTLHKGEGALHPVKGRFEPV